VHTPSALLTLSPFGGRAAQTPKAKQRFHAPIAMEVNHKAKRDTDRGLQHLKQAPKTKPQKDKVEEAKDKAVSNQFFDATHPLGPNDDPRNVDRELPIPPPLPSDKDYDALTEQQFGSVFSRVDARIDLKETIQDMMEEDHHRKSGQLFQQSPFNQPSGNLIPANKKLNPELKGMDTMPDAVRHMPNSSNKKGRSR